MYRILLILENGIQENLSIFLSREEGFQEIQAIKHQDLDQGTMEKWQLQRLPPMGMYVG